MHFRRSQHGHILKAIIAYVKEHETISTSQLKAMFQMQTKLASNRLHKLCKSGWLTYKGDATFGVGPRIAGERISPQAGSDDFLILSFIRDNGKMDQEDAEIAIDDLTKRAETSIRRLESGGWIQSEGKLWRPAENPLTNPDVKKRVDAIMKDLRAGVKNFN